MNAARARVRAVPLPCPVQATSARLAQYGVVPVVQLGNATHGALANSSPGGTSMATWREVRRVAVGASARVAQ